MPNDELTLRDRLAMKRTALANERTLLAYARTAMMLVASGATLWKLAPFSAGDRWLGAIAIGAGVVVLAVGTVRFVRTQKGIEIA